MRWICGACSSTAERLTVAQEVAGSKPVGHPISKPNAAHHTMVSGIFTAKLPALELFDPGDTRLGIEQGEKWKIHTRQDTKVHTKFALLLLVSL